ncbi:hypothetical protein C8Q78DRAFT_998771 [Trametes maxima]|nr:hypothetical protein C8Q78DRAFT_998771 [Trametes maxima]
MRLELPVTLHNSDISKTLQGLCHVLLKAWLVAWPLAFPGGVVVIKCWQERGPLGLVARLYVWFARVREYVRPRLYTRYRNVEEEEEYWRSAERCRRAYRASDASSVPEEVPLVRYYTPKLPPLYREKVEKDPEEAEYQLSPKAFCKWHRMVFRGPLHPSLKDAAQQIRYYSSRDRREIYRISRLLSDDGVFRRKTPWTTRYAVMWKKWLDTKGPDVAIVFE